MVDNAIIGNKNMVGIKTRACHVELHSFTSLARLIAVIKLIKFDGHPSCNMSEVIEKSGALKNSLLQLTQTKEQQSQIMQEMG